MHTHTHTHSLLQNYRTSFAGSAIVWNYRLYPQKRYCPSQFHPTSRGKHYNLQLPLGHTHMHIFIHQIRSDVHVHAELLVLLYCVTHRSLFLVLLMHCLHVGHVLLEPQCVEGLHHMLGGDHLFLLVL